MTLGPPHQSHENRDRARMQLGEDANDRLDDITDRIIEIKEIVRRQTALLDRAAVVLSEGTQRALPADRDEAEDLMREAIDESVTVRLPDVIETVVTPRIERSIDESLDRRLRTEVDRAAQERIERAVEAAVAHHMHREIDDVVRERLADPSTALVTRVQQGLAPAVSAHVESAVQDAVDARLAAVGAKARTYRTFAIVTAAGIVFAAILALLGVEGPGIVGTGPAIAGLTIALVFVAGVLIALALFLQDTLRILGERTHPPTMKIP